MLEGAPGELANVLASALKLVFEPGIRAIV